MRKIILGLVAAAAIVTPIAATTTVANAATTATTACTPSAATPRIDHSEYQWVAAVAKPKLHLEYKWTSTTKNPSTDLAHVWLRSLDTTKRGLPQVTRTVIDQPAHAAVTCGVTLPTSFVDQTTCQSPIASAVVPVTPGVKTFLKGVRGYDERVAIDHDVTVTSAMAGQFWVGHEANDGYVISNPDTAAWHVDFQFSCAFDVPTVVDGVPQYGASSNGTWKLGSKVTLTSGSEFQTHGGTTCPARSPVTDWCSPRPPGTSCRAACRTASPTSPAPRSTSCTSARATSG